MNYRLAKDVELENADGVCVLLKNSGDAAVPNRLGGVVVRRLLEGGLGDCIDYISEECGRERCEVEVDVGEFIRELEGRGLVERVEGQ